MAAAPCRDASYTLEWAAIPFTLTMVSASMFPKHLGGLILGLNATELTASAGADEAAPLQLFEAVGLTAAAAGGFAMALKGAARIPDGAAKSVACLVAAVACAALGVIETMLHLPIGPATAAHGAAIAMALLGTVLFFSWREGGAAAFAPVPILDSGVLAVRVASMAILYVWLIWVPTTAPGPAKYLASVQWVLVLALVLLSEAKLMANDRKTTCTPPACLPPAHPSPYSRTLGAPAVAMLRGLMLFELMLLHFVPFLPAVASAGVVLTLALALQWPAFCSLDR